MRRVFIGVAAAFALTAQLAAGAAAAGPGGWDHLGLGATVTAPALNGAVYALNNG